MAMDINTTLQPEPDNNGSTNLLQSDSQPVTAPETDPLPQSPEADSGSAPAAAAAASTSGIWPGWPGDCVFRLIVPVVKVGSIIGRKGDIIKTICDQTRARIRILDAPVGTPDSLVLISGKEEPEASLSPAMDAVIRVFKRVTGFPEGDVHDFGASGIAFCSFRFLVTSSQAINLIGKQGSIIKSIQETTGSSVRVLPENEMPFYVAADERIVDMQGEASKVLKALEAIVGHLRKFLVDHSVLPLFEKNYNALISQDRQPESQVETWSNKSLLQTTSQGGIDTEYSLSAKREALLFGRETPLGSQIQPSRISLFGQDPSPSSIRSSMSDRASGAIVTQATHTMQVPISYAEQIIGIGGDNIAYIRHASGAAITVHECRGSPNKIIVKIKGTTSEVQKAQRLIQDFLSNNREPVMSKYGKYDSGLKSAYSQRENLPHPSSMVLAGQSYHEYETSSLGGGYRCFRL